MRVHRNLLWASLIPAMLLTGCGGQKEEEEKKKEDETISALGAMSGIKELAAQAEESQKKGSAKTVDFRVLKDLLPDDAEGIPRKEANGEKNGAAGFVISTATGKYANQDDSETMELSIIDGGGSMMMVGLAAWSMIEVDKEDEHGYEKTGQYGDNKSYEKYNNDSKEGEISVLVNKRFIVSAKGHGVSMGKIKAALEDIDLDKLAALK
ncbi:transposase [Spirosoma koreense]